MSLCLNWQIVQITVLLQTFLCEHKGKKYPQMCLQLCAAPHIEPVCIFNVFVPAGHASVRVWRVQAFSIHSRTQVCTWRNTNYRCIIQEAQWTFSSSNQSFKTQVNSLCLCVVVWFRSYVVIKHSKFCVKGKRNSAIHRQATRELSLRLCIVSGRLMLNSLFFFQSDSKQR